MNTCTAKACIPAPVGLLTLTATDCALTGVYMEGQRYFDPDVLSEVPLAPAQPILRMAALWLEDYFSGRCPDPKVLPLAPLGTAFQTRVWKLLQEIPYGETVTYGELALRLGMHSPGARAVGGAVGRNPIGIIIPCHRVLGA